MSDRSSPSKGMPPSSLSQGAGAGASAGAGNPGTAASSAPSNPGAGNPGRAASSSPSNGGRTVALSSQGAGNPGMTAPSSPSNGGRTVALSSPSAHGTGTAGGKPPPPAEDFNYGSIVDVIARMDVDFTVEPSSMLDMLNELPPWLRPAVENEFVRMEPFTAVDPKFSIDDPSRTTLWMKVSSAAALFDAVAAAPPAATQPPAVYLFVMPTIPLRDAHQISQMVQGAAENLPPLKPTVNIINPDGLANKVAAFVSASEIIARFTAKSQEVHDQLNPLLGSAQAHIQHAHQRRGEYEAAKDVFEGVPEEDNLLKHLDLITAASIHLLTRDVASVARIGHESMAGLDVSLTDTVAKLEAAMRNLTFMGCAPPPPPAAGGGAGAN